MTKQKLIFISFEREGDVFRTVLFLKDYLLSVQNPEELKSRAVKVYSKALIRMDKIIKEIDDCRSFHPPIPARLTWKLGNAVFQLKESLEDLSLQIDDLYKHLVRDLGVKRKWIEKVIILRRYLPDQKMIPRMVTWGKLEKGTRRKAKQLSQGLELD